VLVYYEQYSHMLQLDSTSRALFPDHFMPHLTEYIRQLIRKIVTIHPLRQRLVLTEQHYAMVAKHFMSRHLRDGSRCVLGFSSSLHKSSLVLLDYFGMQMYSTHPMMMQSNVIPVPSRLYSALLMYFLLPVNLIKSCKKSSVPTRGLCQGAFMKYGD